ncbi:Imm1 family immunity protein [Kitasatospora sp. NPDC058190]|uniref:Imm1 family immunity protein n=1 Tax=Kitasatospora sp. NPDC058190 TaxID=3346371 RepID=UPI0036D9A1D4
MADDAIRRVAGMTARARAQAQYTREHSEQPVAMTSAEDVDHLVDELLAGPEDHNLAEIHSLERELTWAGYPDHQFLVGVNRDLGVGVVSFMDESGNYASTGSPDARPEPDYYSMMQKTVFPDGSEIPVDLVRSAVKEFVLSGGQRPSCIEWSKFSW